MCPRLRIVWFAVVVVIVNLSAAATTGNIIRSEARVASVPGNYAQNSNANNNNDNSESTGVKTQEPIVGPVVGVYGGYTGNQNQMVPSTYSQPNSYNGYSYSAQGNAGSPPMFGLSSTGDISMTANFGPVIWGFVAGLVLVILVIWILNLFGGFQLLGGAFEGLRSKNEKGNNTTGKSRSIDLDHISSIVYDAMDKYNKWNYKSDQ